MLVTSQAAGYSMTDDLSAVRHEPFVLISRQRSPTFHQHALNLCSKYGFRPRIVQEVPELTTVLALVKAGLGVSVIPESFGINRFQGISAPCLSNSAIWLRQAAALNVSTSCALASRDIERGCSLKELAEPLDHPPQLDCRLDPILSMTWARCALIVRSVVPSRLEICLLSRPPTTSAKTSRSRSVSLS